MNAARRLRNARAKMTPLVLSQVWKEDGPIDAWTSSYGEVIYYRFALL